MNGDFSGRKDKLQQLQDENRFYIQMVIFCRSQDQVIKSHKNSQCLLRLTMVLVADANLL